MIEQHLQLVNQYKELEILRGKSITKTVAIEIVMIAYICVGILVFWHKRSLDRKTAGIGLEGMQIEKQNPFSGLSFFRNYLKEFNVLGKIVKIAIFDFFFLYFFIISITQLLKSLNLEVVMSKLAQTVQFRTLIISALLKKELQGS